MVAVPALPDPSEVSAADLAAKFFRGLGDPTRLRNLRMLIEEGDKNVGELVGRIGARRLLIVPGARGECRPTMGPI